MIQKRPRIQFLEMNKGGKGCRIYSTKMPRREKETATRCGMADVERWILIRFQDTLPIHLTILNEYGFLHYRMDHSSPDTHDHLHLHRNTSHRDNHHP